MIPLVEAWDVLKGKEDAPNYQEATPSQKKAGKMCGTCKAWDESATDNPDTGYCEWYDFTCNREHICDAWAGKGSDTKKGLVYDTTPIAVTSGDLESVRKKLCPEGKAAAKRKFKVYPSAYANGWAVQYCRGKFRKKGKKGKK